jgi:hypothetical protein
MTFAHMSMVVSYGGTPNIVFYGYARFGTALDEAGWMIFKQTFDDRGNLVRNRAVLNTGEKPEFENVWQDSISLTISSITKAAIAVLETTTDHGLETDDRIEIADCDATEANGDGWGSVMFKVRKLTDTTVALVDVNTDLDVDSSGWAAAGTTGLVFKRPYANYVAE